MQIDIRAIIESVRQRTRERHSLKAPSGSLNTHTPAGWSVTVRFGKDGNSTDFIKSGFSHTEDAITWNDGVTATLELPAPPNGEDVILSADLLPNVSPMVLHQAIRLSIGDELIAVWSVSQASIQHAIIFRRHFDNKRSFILRLDTPDAFSLATTGLGNDSRTLAAAFRTLQLQLLNPTAS